MKYLSGTSGRLVREAGLATLAASIFFFRLGNLPLKDYDEAIYAEVSKEILGTHDWLTLHYQHQFFFDKPPIDIWIRAIFFRWFGINEVSARAVSALAGVALVMITYATAKHLWGVRAGVCSALMLLTMKHFVLSMRFGTTDALLCLCIYASLYAYVRVRSGDARWWYGVWAFVGCGIMVKSAAALVAPIVIGIDLFWERRKGNELRTHEFWLGLMLAFLLVIPWHLWMVISHGVPFIYQYLGHEIVARVIKPIDQSGGPLFKYAPVLMNGSFPWCLIAATAVLADTRERRIPRFLLILQALVVVLYSIVASKHNWYILPVYPAMAMVGGNFVAVQSENRQSVRRLFACCLIIGLFFAGYKIAHQSNPVRTDLARLSELAKSAHNHGGPLLVLMPIIGPNACNPDIGPTPVFYSERTVRLVSVGTDGMLPPDLLQGGRPADVIFATSLEPLLLWKYSIESPVRREQLSLATIRKKL